MDSQQDNATASVEANLNADQNADNQGQKLRTLPPKIVKRAIPSSYDKKNNS